MSISMFIIGAILVGAIMLLVFMFGFFDKLEKKFSWETARKLCFTIPAVLAGLLFGYAGKTRFIEGNYNSHSCNICFRKVEQGYKVTKMFYTSYYCEEHENSARERAGLKSTKVEDSWGYDELDAVLVAKKVVKSKLKSPSTAVFCENSECTVKYSNDFWTVSGYVDAQNGFGATIRNSFTVKFSFEADGTCITDYCNIY